MVKLGFAPPGLIETMARKVSDKLLGYHQACLHLPMRMAMAVALPPPSHVLSTVLQMVCYITAEVQKYSVIKSQGFYNEHDPRHVQAAALACDTHRLYAGLFGGDVEVYHVLPCKVVGDSITIVSHLVQQERNLLLLACTTSKQVH